jgi:hypothetical protein
LIEVDAEVLAELGGALRGELDAAPVGMANHPVLITE